MTDMGQIILKLKKENKLSKIKTGQAMVTCMNCGTVWVFDDPGKNVTYTFDCSECGQEITYIGYGPIEGVHYGNIKTRRGIGSFLRKLPRRIKNR